MLQLFHTLKMRSIALFFFFSQTFISWGAPGLRKTPNLELEYSFKTTIEDYPMGYSSASFAISNEILYVLNGANVGNYILKFDLEGNYLGQYPGWYNFPVDMIMGGPGNDQVLMSAIGAKGDDDVLRFGMVLYNKSGEFFHGLQEAETGLKRPYGLSNISGSS